MRLTTATKISNLLLRQPGFQDLPDHFCPVHGDYYHMRDYKKQHHRDRASGDTHKMETLSQRLQAAREESKMTQAQLAKAANIKSQGTIGMLESGERKTSSHIPAIASALKVSALWLAKGIGPMRPSGDKTLPTATQPESPKKSALGLKVFALPCPACHKVTHQSFVELEVNEFIPCSCGHAIKVADYYSLAVLETILKGLGGAGYELRK